VRPPRLRRRRRSGTRAQAEAAPRRSPRRRACAHAAAVRNVLRDRALRPPRSYERTQLIVSRERRRYKPCSTDSRSSRAPARRPSTRRGAHASRSRTRAARASPSTRREEHGSPSRTRAARASPSTRHEEHGSPSRTPAARASRSRRPRRRRAARTAPKRGRRAQQPRSCAARAGRASAMGREDSFFDTFRRMEMEDRRLAVQLRRLQRSARGRPFPTPRPGYAGAQTGEFRSQRGPVETRGQARARPLVESVTRKSRDSRFGNGPGDRALA